MQQATSTTFDRVENSQLGQGKTTEYKNNLGETLAYVDYSEDGTTAAVTVFTPYKGGERRYTSRPAAAAEGIAARHLAKEGFEVPAPAPAPLAPADLDAAFNGSYYTILGAGGDLNEWVAGYNGLLQQAGIGTPAGWFTTTGQAINEYAATKGTVGDPFADDLTCLMFQLDGLNGGALAMFKLQMQDRWFDDIVGNMVAGSCTDDDEEEE